MDYMGWSRVQAHPQFVVQVLRSLTSSHLFALDFTLCTFPTKPSCVSPTTETRKCIPKNGFFFFFFFLFFPTLHQSVQINTVTCRHSPLHVLRCLLFFSDVIITRCRRPLLTCRIRMPHVVSLKSLNYYRSNIVTKVTASQLLEGDIVASLPRMNPDDATIR